METIVKDTVYTKEMLDGFVADENGLEKLQGILSDRGISYSHLAKENSLVSKILASNPTGDGFDNVQESVTTTIPVETSGVKSEMTPNTGIVKLELIDAKRTGSLRVRDYSYQGRKKTLRRGPDQEPWMFMITKNETLDLKDEDQRALFEHLKTHPYVIGGGGLNPSVRLINEGQDSIDMVEKIELALETQAIIKKLGEKELRDFARILNIADAYRKSPVVVKSKCYQLCEQNPKFVMQMWNDPRKDLKNLVFKGFDAGLVKKTDGVYKFDNLAVGTTEDEVVLWFEKNPDILPGLRNKINKA